MRRFATNFPVAYLLSLGICVSLLIQESGAQCLSDCSAHKCCDWWGVRPCLEDHGIEFDAAVTQFYQGVASGGREALKEISRLSMSIAPSVVTRSPSL